MKVAVLSVAIAVVVTVPVRSQALVDPSKVAPEFREAAEKRRAKQLRQSECAKKAEAEKILRRDLTAYLNQCIEAKVQATKP